MTDHYRVRILHGDIEVEVESHDKQFVEDNLEKYARVDQLPRRTKTAENKGKEEKPSEGKQLSLQEFKGKINPTDGPEYVLTATYYREKYKGEEKVKTADISQDFKDMKFKYSNTSEAVRGARNRRFIMEKGKGCFIATNTGEEWIEERLRPGEE